MVYPTKDRRVTAAFGVPGSWAAGYHTGTDFGVPTGTVVRATKGGVVVFAGYSGGWGTAYGNHVVVSSYHNGHFVRHLYAHLSKISVGYGERIDTGEVIGLSGNTGNTTGPHLHYEERTAPFGYYNHKRPVLLGFVPPPVISLRKLKFGKRNLHVRRLKRRLNRYFPKKKKLVGLRFNNKLKDRYAEYQRSLGYTGKDANGLPGRSSLQKLGFRVRP